MCLKKGRCVAEILISLNQKMSRDHNVFKKGDMCVRQANPL